MEFTLPELGEGIEGGDVIEVLVTEGTEITEGDPLLELETSKATIPIPAPQAGRISKIHVRSGMHVKVGEPLVTIEPVGKSARQDRPRARDDEKHEGAEPDRSQPVEDRAAPTLQPDTPADEPKSRGKGTRPAPATVKAQAAPRRQIAIEAAPSAPSKGDGSELVPAGPATRRLARELGVDLHRVHGSGPGGRINEDDVKAFVRNESINGEMKPTESDRSATGRPAPPLPEFAKWGPVRREALGNVRRSTAEHMSLAWSQIPQVTHFDEADITEWEQFRKRHTAEAESRGAKLTMTVLAIKASATALRGFPFFNASFDAATNEVILKQYYHVGVAVDTEFGLLVPVIRDVDKKGLLQLAVELSAVADRARQKKLSIDDMQGGTFTITNLGGIGGTAFSPIVNYPQVAILGLARANEKQVVRNGQVAIRVMLPVCLSYDHRVIDGAAAARFTRRFVELIEDPFLMVMEG